MATSSSKPLVLVLVIVSVLALLLVLTVSQALAQGTFSGSETIVCDDVGYSLTINASPDWSTCDPPWTYLPGVSWCHNLPWGSPLEIRIIPHQVTYPPASDPVSSTWASLGKDTATIYYRLWWRYSGVPLSWINVYFPGPTFAETHLVTVDRATCQAQPAQPASGCAREPKYYMYTMEDANQPDTWQKYCYIISSDGHPGVEAQARVCSVPGSGYTYRATKMHYAGWVYADCNGKASYGWPAWDPAWYRPGFGD